MVKLYSQIDTSKQLPLFNCIHDELLQTDSMPKIKLALLVLRDALKFKHGNRVSHLCVIQIVNSLTHVMTKRFETISGDSECMSLLT